MGPLDASRPWETRDVVGMYRFLQRLWRAMVDETTGEIVVDDAPADDETRRLLHRTIDAVRREMDALRFNTAIAKLIELNNHVTKLAATPREVAEPMVLMLAPLVPHVAEELWHRLGHDDTVTYTEFPVADPALLVDDTVEYPVQVNGKVRGRITVPVDADRDDGRGRRPRRRQGRRRDRRRGAEEGDRRARQDGQRRRLTTSRLTVIARPSVVSACRGSPSRSSASSSSGRVADLGQHLAAVLPDQRCRAAHRGG